MVKIPNSRWKRLLAGALIVGTLWGPKISVPEKDTTPDAYNSEQALVIDDNLGTIGRVEQYLVKKGYNPVHATTVEQAKEIIKRNPNLTRIVSDLDLSRSYNSHLDHCLGGYEILNWLDSEQKSGKYQNIQDVTLHSTTLNSGNLEGIVAKPVVRYVAGRINSMGNSQVKYRAQPKTLILK